MNDTKTSSAEEMLKDDSDYSRSSWEFMSFDFYKKPSNYWLWRKCNDCDARPKIWEFDNGRSAHCLCGVDRYNHTHEVRATPIMDSVKKTGGFRLHDSDELRKNWNNYILSLANQ